MSEAIAFFTGFIGMGCLWFYVDYLDHNSAYRRGYREGYSEAFEDIAKAEADAARGGPT